MAVQAQYPSNIPLFNRNVQEEKNMILGNSDYSLQSHPGGLVDQAQMMFDNNGVLGGANPRKRSRVEPATNQTTTTANMNYFNFSLQNHQQHYQQQQNQNQNDQLIDLSQLQNHQQQQQIVSTGLRLSFGEQQQQQQQIQQQQQSVVSLFSEDLAIQLKQQSDELNYFFHAQAEQLRRTLAEKRQRHYLSLISAAEDAAARRLREKSAAVEKATLQNAELEAKAAQLTLEAQLWRAKAQAQEAQAASLQAQLQHALSIPTTGAREQGIEEGGLGCAGRDEVEDSESCYVDPASEGRVDPGRCRVCMKRVVSVVLLPCRHLCVCGECDDVVQACPVCLAVRTASVEVYLT